MSDLAQIVHKAVTDQEFRAALVTDPVTALSRQGLVVSEEEMAALSDTLHLVGRSSEDLLAKLLSTAGTREGVWHFKEKAQRFSVLEP